MVQAVIDLHIVTINSFFFFDLFSVFCVSKSWMNDTYFCATLE